MLIDFELTIKFKPNTMENAENFQGFDKKLNILKFSPKICTFLVNI
jgi:hypothetical protein